jgi:anti-sigma factor RsiW
MSRVFRDDEIREYILGDMYPPDEGELEAAYFRDPELLARVDVARDDLLDDYVAGRLSDADREKCERRLLASDKGREQLAMARALRERGG